MQPTEQPRAIDASHVTNDPQRVTEPNLYATIDEYAERLKVSRGTVFSWVRGGLPSFRIGRTRRIVIEKADRWLENGGADRSRTSTRTKRGANTRRL